MQKKAMVREVSPKIGNCELTFLTRREIDYHHANREHQNYQRALERAGCEVVLLPSLPDSPDATFVEDTAVILDELAVITRPGAPSRQHETESVAKVLEGFYDLQFITTPGSLEGGDVLKIGRDLFVGISPRTNAEGIRQLEEFVRPLSYRVVAVPVSKCLHLKTACTLVSNDTILLNSAWVEKSFFHGLEILDVDLSEPFAANSLQVNDTLLYPTHFTRTAEKLERRFKVTPVDISELSRAEAGLSCLSLLY